MSLKLIEKKDIAPLINVREGEQKIGENILLGSQLKTDELKDIDAQFVIFGVPEDAGPRANLGKAGAESAWNHFLPSFLNIQENDYLSSDSILLVGELDFRNDPFYQSSDPQELRKLVSKIDQEVADLVELIVRADKIPILIGGGHNNAYGLLKGCSNALGHSINCINLDPHADFRALEGRHSGNGFSYAAKEGFLEKYYICGLHQSYNSQAMLREMNESKNIDFSTFDACIIQARSSYKDTLKKGLAFVSQNKFGVELDCDSIQQFPVSAQTPSGVSANQARMYAYTAASHHNAIYFHLTEAAPALAGNDATIWAKLMSYLVSDFIKAKSSMFSSKDPS